ncbi:MAG: amidohydrolase family protein [Verrucomicrobiales bacterium]|jgi:predicted amidohydrolase YtcJ
MPATSFLTRVTLAFFSLGVAVSLKAQEPNVILFNGKILTVDENFSTEEALAVTGERIAAVGDSSTISAMAGPDTQRIDLEGRTVIPGLIDNHLHYMRGASRWRFEARIDGITDRDEALRIIAAKAKEAGQGEWVFVAGGWSEQQFLDGEGGFTTEQLDAAAPDNPVFLQKSYSRAYMNSLAAAEIGSTGSSGSTRGSSKGSSRSSKGSSGRSRGGKSSGRSSGGARGTINAALQNLPERSEAQRVEDAVYFNEYLNQLGLTTVYDVGRGSDGNFAPIESLQQSKKLTIRVFHTLRYQAYNVNEVNNAVELIASTSPRSNSDWFGLIGMGEHVYSPVHDSTMRASLFGRDQWQQFERLAEAAAAGGWHIHEHAMQDNTAQEILNIGERLSASHSVKGLRWTLAHCDLISKETIQRARDLGFTLAVHNKTAKPAVDGKDSPPVSWMEESGITWGLGSDGTVVATVNPFHTLWWVTSGKVFPDITSIQNPVSREAALIAHTRSNAYLMFKEKDLGSLEVGKFADLVVLDRDYLSVPVDKIRNITPTMTMVGGRVVFESK